MADLFAVAGARISIGTALDSQNGDFTAADFAAQTWVEIDGWETAGAIGDAAEIITTNLINRGRTTKQKGTRDAGTMENQFAVIASDVGQTAMEAAEATDDNYAFRIQYDDAPPAAAGATTSSTPTTQYFVGLVTSWRDTNGGANTTRMKAATIAINSNIVTVDAVAGA